MADVIAPFVNNNLDPFRDLRSTSWSMGTTGGVTPDKPAGNPYQIGFPPDVNKSNIDVELLEKVFKKALSPAAYEKFLKESWPIVKNAVLALNNPKMKLGKIVGATLSPEGKLISLQYKRKPDSESSKDILYKSDGPWKKFQMPTGLLPDEAKAIQNVLNLAVATSEQALANGGEIDSILDFINSINCSSKPQPNQNPELAMKIFEFTNSLVSDMIKQWADDEAADQLQDAQTNKILNEKNEKEKANAKVAIFKSLKNKFQGIFTMAKMMQNTSQQELALRNIAFAQGQIDKYSNISNHQGSGVDLGYRFVVAPVDSTSSFAVVSLPSLPSANFSSLMPTLNLGSGSTSSGSSIAAAA